MISKAEQDGRGGCGGDMRSCWPPEYAVRSDQVPGKPGVADIAPCAIAPRASADGQRELGALFEHLDALTAKLDAADRRGGRCLAIRVSTPLRGVAGPYTAHVSEWKSRTYRTDQQGRRSLSANAVDPWRKGDGRHQFPAGCNAASLASGIDWPTPGQCCCSGRCTQDGSRTLGHDPA